MGRRFQFSLRALLVTVTVVAIDLGLMLRAPPKIAEAALSALTVLAAAIFTTGIVYGGGHVRPFCIGGLFPVAIACRWAVDQIPAMAEQWYPALYSGGVVIGLIDGPQRNSALFGGAILMSLLFGNICLALRPIFSASQ